ncbi:MAG: carboxypeptidase-like regulatory domain-containing protein [Pyrinomonadaceae bacterium]
MKLRNISLALFVLVFLNLSLLTFFVHARPLPKKQKQGRLSGVVFDVNDARVAGAKITLMRDPDMREVLTDDAGQFNIQLPAGTYRFTVSANGFCKFERAGLIITPGTTELINVHLEVLAYDSLDACKCTARRRQ